MSPHYLVNLIVDEKALGMFYFMRGGSSPKFTDREKIAEEYLSFMTSEQEFRARDLVLYSGGPTVDGRLGCWWDKRDGTGYTFKQSNFLASKEKLDLKDFEVLRKTAKEIF